MKQIALLCLVFFLEFSLGAQTVAADFQKNDCSGPYHHLYAELDSGYVILLDFVMFNCAPCIYATNALATIQSQFEASHPGKVRFYTMGFLNNMSCPQMNSWKRTNSFTHTVFSGENSQVEYYGGMGMPTIVVLGGLTEHKVYYNHLGYSSEENTAINNAINLAISESNTTGADPLPDSGSFSVFPNPFGASLTVRLQQPVHATHVVLTDLAGAEVLRAAVTPESVSAGLQLPAGQIPPGFYFMALVEGSRQTGLRKLVKK